MTRPTATEPTSTDATYENDIWNENGPYSGLSTEFAATTEPAEILDANDRETVVDYPPSLFKNNVTTQNTLSSSQAQQMTSSRFDRSAAATDDDGGGPAHVTIELAIQAPSAYSEGHAGHDLFSETSSQTTGSRHSKTSTMSAALVSASLSYYTDIMNCTETTAMRSSIDERQMSSTTAQSTDVDYENLSIKSTAAITLRTSYGDYDNLQRQNTITGELRDGHRMRTDFESSSSSSRSESTASMVTPTVLARPREGGWEGRRKSSRDHDEHMIRSSGYHPDQRHEGESQLDNDDDSDVVSMKISFKDKSLIQYN